MILERDQQDLPIQRQEERILGALMPDTFRGISMYRESFGLIEEDFIHLIEGKRVGDLGSGFDGLALDLGLRGVDTEIISINPRRVLSDFYANRKKHIKWNYRVFSERSKQWKQMSQALQIVDAQAVAAFAHNLSPIPDESLDIMIDHYAFWHHSDFRELDMFQMSLEEIMKKIKADGYCMISVLRQENRVPDWKEIAVKELGLDIEYMKEEVDLLHKGQIVGLKIKNR